jgi:opacity protein-like surface antigen
MHGKSTSGGKMKRTIKLFILVVFLSALSSAAAAANPTGDKVKTGDVAVQSAQNWLGIVDSGKYGESWNKADEYLKQAVSKKDFEKSLQGVRRPLGKVIKRSLASTNYTTALPGAPDGEYVVIQFKTEFENKKESIETVTPKKNKDGAWRVSGYYIK